MNKHRRFETGYRNKVWVIGALILFACATMLCIYVVPKKVSAKINDNISQAFTANDISGIEYQGRWP